MKVGDRSLPLRTEDLQTQLCTPPVSPLCVITNGVTSAHPDPLRNRPVLFAFLGQLLLNAEGFKGRHSALPTSERLERFKFICLYLVEISSQRVNTWQAENLHNRVTSYYLILIHSVAISFLP